MPNLPLWPFPAAQEISEVLEWRTDVLQTRTSEQRIALRPRPREIVTFRYRLDALGMARAAELARAGFVGEWRVPLWHMALTPSSDLVQGASEILIDTGSSDFRSGQMAALAVDGREAIPITVTSCPIPDDHISLRRSALFMARWVLRNIRAGGRPC